MKIYIITKEPFPNGMAAVKRIISYAKGWESRGIECEILIYTRTEKYGQIPKNTLGFGEIDGIKYKYVKGTPLRENNVISRYFNDYLDKIRLKKYLNKNLRRGDIVFAFGLDIKNEGLINMIHSKNASYVQEICEYPFGTTIESRTTKNKRIRFEHKIMPKLDGVIAISEALVHYAKNHCNPTCNIIKIPILVDYDKYYMQDSSKETKIPYIFHSGTLFQQKDGFLDMLKAFGIVCRNLPFDVKFYSTGKVEGSRHEAEIRKIIEDYNLQDKVTFLGYVSDDKIIDYLSKASIVIINKLTTLQNKYCFSTKLGEYMAAGKSIIITDVGEAMNWLTHDKDSYIIPPNNIEALSNAINKLFTNPDLRDRLGKNAQKTCLENFAIDANADKLKNFVNSFSV